MGLEEIKKARTFHESFPQYSETPLTKLPHMASYLGVKEVYVKDESYRFGLNAFKVLGGSFAMARYIAKKPERMFFIASALTHTNGCAVIIQKIFLYQR